VIVLDTNVISELMRATPDRHVIDWVDAQPASDLFLTAITLAELLYGVARLPHGRRRSTIADTLERVVTTDFDRRVVSFDDIAAGQYAELVAARERAGRPIGLADAQIAAICRSYGATLATRNTADFEDTGVVLANPWDPTA
jgi:hypothetical protein